MWDRRTYHTNDDILEVLEFMELNMPGFDRSGPNPFGEVAYHNSKCLDNWMGRLAASINMGDPDYIGDPNIPCASVKIYQDFTLSSGTYIQVWLSWPFG